MTAKKPNILMLVLASVRSLLTRGTASLRRSTFRPHGYWHRRYHVSGRNLRAVGHTDLSISENRRDYETKVAELRAVLRTLFPDTSGMRIMDAGCGIGVFSAVFADMGFQVTGVDFVEAAAEEARKNCTGTFVVARLDTLKLEPPFHCVACIDVLFHIVQNDRWERVLANLMAHLAADGCLLLHEELADREQSPELHVRFRTLQKYEACTNKLGARLHIHRRYRLPVESVWKDILVYVKRDA